MKRKTATKTARKLRPRTKAEAGYQDRKRQEFDAGLNAAILTSVARYRSGLKRLTVEFNRYRHIADSPEVFRDCLGSDLARVAYDSDIEDLRITASSISYMLGLQRRLRAEPDFKQPQLESFLSNWIRILADSATSVYTSHGVADMRGLATAVKAVSIIAVPYLKPQGPRLFFLPKEDLYKKEGGK